MQGHVLGIGTRVGARARVSSTHDRALSHGHPAQCLQVVIAIPLGKYSSFRIDTNKHWTSQYLIMAAGHGSNRVTVRIRLYPTPSQICLDRLTMSVQLRVKFQGTGAQSFFFVCADIFSLPDVAIASKTAGGVACHKFVNLMGTLVSGQHEP